MEEIIMQALMEVKDDLRRYGPFVLQPQYNGTKELINLIVDGNVVLTAEIEENRRTITLIYFRKESTMHWAEDFCQLADAHVRMSQKDEGAIT